MKQLFIIATSGDIGVHEKVTFMYAKNAMLKGWMEAVRLIFWGPSQLLLLDGKFAKNLDELRENNVEFFACKACSDQYKISERLEQLGISVVYVGEMVSQMLEDGWHSLTF
jgi:hypothetical protein